jgi:energy-coupling factor transporter ATP-binding protein EcfA2
MPHDDLPSDYARADAAAPRRRTSGHQTIARRKRPITVTVSGERGSGKTTLIAVVAQALENSGHLVNKPDHVPNATTAVADLHEQFDVTFVERYEADVRELGEALQAAEVERLKAECARLAEIDEKLRAEIVAVSAARDSAFSLLRDEQNAGDEARAELTKLRWENEVNAVTIDALSSENASLHKSPIDPARVSEQIEIAFAEVRDATMLDMERRRVQRLVDERKAEAVKLRVESDARFECARKRVQLALSGSPMPSPIERRVWQAASPNAADVRRYPGDGPHNEEAATAKLAAANLALMAEDHAEGC